MFVEKTKHEIYMKNHMIHLIDIASFPEVNVAHMYFFHIII